jgi:MFS transporter, Spinster family, sphingosine-1-phosphate transporter
MNTSPSAPNSSQRSAWLIVGVLWVIALLNYLDRLMITTMRDAVKADIAMTDAQFGLLTSVFLWVYGFFSPLGGYLADRFGRSRIILGSLFIWSAVTWATGHMHSFEGLLVARAVMGLSEACYIPAALALIADYHRGPTRSLATGLHMSGIYTGAALGGVGGAIAEHYSWRAGFSWFGVGGIAYAVVVFFVLKDVPVRGGGRSETAPERPATSLGATLLALVRQPSFVLLIVSFALVSLANWGIYGWLPTYLKERFSLGLGSAGLAATGYVQVASFVGVLFGGIWADRWSRTQSRARLWVPAIGYCIVGPCLFLGINSASLAVAIAGLVVYGLGRGFYDANLMPIVRSVADERYSATGYGLLNFIGCLVGGAMVYVGGWMKDAQIDLARVFQFSAAGLLLTGVLLFCLRPRRAGDAGS